jgi:hypothetical protein
MKMNADTQMSRPPRAPYFFGYGSLVNTATHSYEDAQPARLKGWRRQWVQTGLREAAFLTAIRCGDSEIDGLIAAVPGADWAALDEREWAYDRLAATDAVSHGLCASTDVSVYAVPEERHAAGSEVHPVLLSYLDVVVQGYLQTFGEDGVAEFFATTGGWDVPVLDDRRNPRYPRHQYLTQQERTLTDAHLQSARARIIHPA